MRSFNHTCQGESHKAVDKVCQDASFSACSPNLSMAIVCDGHGGERYFRSDQGALFALEATHDCVAAFVQTANERLFNDKPLTQRQAIASEAKSDTLTKTTTTDNALRQLFASIIYNWREKVKGHAQEHPLTEQERARVDSRHGSEFESGIGLEKTYGCTLMCHVHTPAYWFAFHIGDGKCIAFDKQGQWSEPIPWDDRCFLNKTTSLCDSAALDEFRYCYGANDSHPMAVFLGSDGIDDSFGETENMVNFYVQVLKALAKEGEDRVMESIVETLPLLSKRGSRDDMSIACLYEEGWLEEGAKALVTWQKTRVEAQLEAIQEKINRLNEKVAALAPQLPPPSGGAGRLQIEYNYAQKDLAQAREAERALSERLAKFSAELDACHTEDDAV